MLNNYILIGEVLKPQGTRGTVKIRPETDNPKRFLDIHHIFVQKQEQFIQIEISDVKIRDGFVYCTLCNTVDRDGAEQLRGLLLFIDRLNAVKLSEGINFICDMIDCQVVNQIGDVIGSLVDIIKTGANDVYVIKTQKGQILIPALQRVILSVDIIGKQIVVNEEKLSEVAVFED